MGDTEQDAKEGNISSSVAISGNYISNTKNSINNYINVTTKASTATLMGLVGYRFNDNLLTYINISNTLIYADATFSSPYSDIALGSGTTNNYNIARTRGNQFTALLGIQLGKEVLIILEPGISYINWPGIKNNVHAVFGVSFAGNWGNLL